MLTMTTSLYGLLSNPLVLGASVAGALTVVVVALLVVLFRRAGATPARRVLLAVVAVVLTGFAVVSIFDRIEQTQRAAERRALAQRSAELTAQALAPGSTLACLDGAAGDAVEIACEKMVFAGPQSTAAAVAYMAAQLTLLSDGLAFARYSPDFAATLAGLRRAIELDRYGIAAHVLAVRDGCTAERCAAFALLGDANVIKANLKAQVFNQYVSRYAANWDKSEPLVKTQGPAPVASATDSLAPSKTPLGSKYSFPSAASIPPVSIMNSEPPLPQQATDAQAPQPAPLGTASVPLPPKRPPPPSAPLPQQATDAQAAQPAPPTAVGTASVPAQPKRPPPPGAPLPLR